MGGARGFDDFRSAGVDAAVGEVVVEGVVEQHRVLRNHADVPAQRGLRDRADVLAVDKDAAAADVEEAEQQARQGGFAGAAGAHHGELAPGRDDEVDLLEDGAAGVVGEAHALEAHLACAHLQFRRAGRVGDLRDAAQQAEQLFHVGERVADLAVDGAEEVEGDEELDQVGVDQHQVAEGHLAVRHALRGQAHHGGDAAGDDEGLAGVEPGQRHLARHRGVLGAAQVGAQAPGFVVLVVEVFHRLVVEQAVDGAGVGGGVGLVHGAAVFQAPVGDQHGEGDVDRQGHQGDGAEPGVVLGEQHARHHEDFQQGGADVEQGEIDQEADRARAALDVHGQAAGAPFQVEAQGLRVQVAEDVVDDAAHGALQHAREQGVAQFGEGGVAEAQQAVEDDEGEGRGERGGIGPVEAVDDFLQHQRHRHVGQLGQQQQGEGQQHAALVAPDVGRQRPGRAPLAGGGARSHGIGTQAVVGHGAGTGWNNRLFSRKPGLGTQSFCRASRSAALSTATGRLNRKPW